MNIPAAKNTLETGSLEPSSINVLSRTGLRRSKSFQITKLSFLVLAVSILTDTLLFTILSPYTVLTAPTVYDAMLEGLPIVLTVGLVIALMALITDLRFAKAVAVLSSVAKIVCVIELVFNPASILNLIAALSVASICLIASTITISIKSTRVVSKKQKKSFSAMTLLSLMELAKLIYLTSILKPETYEGPGIILRVAVPLYACCLGLVLMEANRDKRKVSVELRNSKGGFDKSYSIALLVVSATLLWLPISICFSNCVALSNSFVALSICFSAGALVAYASDKTSRYLKLNISFDPDLNILVGIFLAAVLSLSKWFAVTAVTLAILGALLITMVRENLATLVSKAENPQRLAMLSLAATIAFTFASTAFLMNSTSYLPPVYVFRSVGLLACLAFLLLLIAFRPPRVLALKIFASAILNRRSNTKLLERMYQDCRSTWLVSKLSLTKSILLANFLKTPLIVISNDGFLNLWLTQNILSLLDVRIHTNISDVEKTGKSIPVLFLQKSNQAISIDNASFLDRRRKIANRPIYTIEHRFERIERSPALALNAVPSES